MAIALLKSSPPQSLDLEPSPCDEQQAILEKINRYTAQRQAQRFSRKTANASVRKLLEDPAASLAFLQKCGIYDENGDLTPRYR